MKTMKFNHDFQITVSKHTSTMNNLHFDQLPADVWKLFYNTQPNSEPIQGTNVTAKSTKMNASYITVYSSPLQLKVQFLLKDQTINFLTHIVHLLTAAVIQMVDLSTLTVVVPLSNTEHVATNQKQTLKDIIHMFT